MEYGLNIAGLLSSSKVMGKQKENCGSIIICGPCQRGALSFFLPLIIYFCHTSCAALWWGRSGWRVNLQESHGWFLVELRCMGSAQGWGAKWADSPLNPRKCLNIGIKPHEQWLETYSIQPTASHGLCFFGGFGMSASPTPGNAFLSAKSLFWLDRISFTCLLFCYKCPLLPELRWGRLQPWLKYRFFFLFFLITFFSLFLPCFLGGVVMPVIQRYSEAVGSKAVWEGRVILKDARNLSNMLFAYLPNRKWVVSLPLSKNSTAECCSEVFQKQRSFK